MRARSAALAALALLVACASPSAPATGQILLYIDTDAPLPPGTNAQTAPTDPMPLFDTARVDVIPPGAADPCAGCSNEFDLTVPILQAGASVGIVPPVGVRGYRARVRLFHVAFTSAAGEPDPSTTLDVTVSLPPVGPTGVIEQTVKLLTDNVGAPMGSVTAPVAATPGRPSRSLVGTWAPAQRVPCSGKIQSDEVCIPGGAYWMGNPLALDQALEDEGTRPRLVVLSPFFLLTTEVTVAEFRAGAPKPPGTPWSGSVQGTSHADWCTFAPAPKEPCSAGFPCDEDAVNCVTWAEARAYCLARNADLPTEAQYEYAESGLQSHLYEWGEDDPTCVDAVFSQQSDGMYTDIFGQCPGSTPHGGPKSPGTGARDRLVLPTGTVVDLAGNLFEWVLDHWNRQDEPCWSASGVYVDPLCTQASPADGTQPMIRGGGWLGEFPGLHAASRQTESGPLPGGADELVGFRCARPVTP